MKVLIRCSFVLCLELASSMAWASKPSMEKVMPPVGTRGTTFQVTAIGSGLSNVKNVVFYNPGLRCNALEILQDDEIRLQIETDPTCKLGSYPFRLSGPNGASEIRSITLTPFAIVPEEEAIKNPVPKNRTIFGTLEGDSIDTYTIELKAGETFSAEVHAMRLGAGFLDTKLDFKDEHGSIIATSDDSPLTQQDPSFSVRVPKSGNYRLSITSVDGRADADSPYALHVGSFPRPFGIFPLGIAAESEKTISAIYDNPQLNRDYRVSSRGLSTGHQGFEISEQGVSCPSLIPLRVFEGNVVKHDPKSSRATTDQLSTPCSVQGLILEKGQRDEISFVAQHSGLHRIEVFAARMGSKLDSVIELRDSSMTLISNGDDFEGLDAKVDFFAEEGQQYHVSIFDKRSNGSEHSPYCLEIGPLQGTITAFLPRRDKRSQARQVIEVPSGNRVLAYFGIRKEGTSTPVSIGLSNLPSSLKTQSGAEQPDSFVIPVVLESTSDGEQSVTLAGVYNTLSGESLEFHQVVDLIHGPADTLFQSATANRVVVSTTTANPFKVDLDPLTVPLAADGTLGLKVRVIRSDDFDLPIEIKLSYLPEWIEATDKISIPLGQTEVVFPIKAFELAKPRTWPIVVEASAGLPSRNMDEAETEPRPRRRSQSPLDFGTVASSLETLQIIETPCTGSIPAISAEQSKTISVQCQVKLGENTPEIMVATLEGLPNRVTAEPVEIDQETSQITFELTLAEDAPLGTFPDIYCQLSGKINDVPVSYCLARRTKLIISKVGESIKDESGNPLSPLEALRRKSKLESPKNQP